MSRGSEHPELSRAGDAQLARQLMLLRKGRLLLGRRQTTREASLVLRDPPLFAAGHEKAGGDPIMSEQERLRARVKPAIRPEPCPLPSVLGASGNPGGGPKRPKAIRSKDGSLADAKALRAVRCTFVASSRKAMGDGSHGSELLIFSIRGRTRIRSATSRKYDG